MIHRHGFVTSFAWLFRLVLVAIACWRPVSLTAAVIVVSPRGSDKAPGTAASPLASVRGARDRVRAMGWAGKEPVMVEIREGVYRFQEPLVMDARDSGAPEAPIVYRAAPGAVVVFSGAQEIKARWTPNSNGVYRTRIPSGLIADQLFVAGERQVLARYPNWDPSQRILGGFAKDAVDPARAARWVHPEGGFLHAMHRHEWGDSHFRILGKNQDGSVKMEGGWQNNRSEEGIHAVQRFVENIYEELDAPGEWFMDSAAGWLFLHPRSAQQLKSTTLELPALKHLIELRGERSRPVRFVRFEGMVLRHTLRTFVENREPLLRSDWTTYRGGAVVFEGTEDCGLRGVMVDEVGGNGVFVTGYNRRVQIQASEVRNAGASSVCFVGLTNAVRSPLFNYHQTLPVSQLDLIPGPRTEDYPADCLVEDCLLSGNGRFEKQTTGVQIAMASRITVRHCTIHDCPRAGINIGDGCWGGHVIEHCDIFDTVKETGDHGSFNSWGRDRFWVPNIQEGNRRVAGQPSLPFLDTIEPITLRNNRWRCDHGWDIDLDDGSSRYVLENNLCLNGGIKLREGFGRRVENNIMVNNTFHPHVWFKESGDGFRHNIVMTDYAPIGMPLQWGNEVDSNLLPNRQALEKSNEGGRDLRSAAGFPGFQDPSRGDYRVGPASPALKVGFRNFEMDRFGVVSPRLKARAGQPRLPSDFKASAVEGQALEQPSFWMGAWVKRIQGQGEMSAAGLPEEKGVALVSVPDNSPAFQMGFRERDVVLKADGKDLVTAGALRSLSGKEVRFTLQRDQKERSINCVLPNYRSLNAGSARLEGPTPLPRYDATKGFIGAWTDLNSRLLWKVSNLAPGRYRVWLEFACEPGSAGSRIRLDAGGQSLEGTVGSTGGWEQFRLLELGVIEWPGTGASAADLTASLRALSKPGPAVLNVRALHWIQVAP